MREGGRTPFRLFLKIHPIWYSHPSRSPLLLGPVKTNLGAIDFSLVESSRVVCMVFLKGSHLLSENLETKLGGKSFQTCLARKVGGLNMQDVFS